VFGHITQEHAKWDISPRITTNAKHIGGCENLGSLSDNQRKPLYPKAEEVERKEAKNNLNDRATMSRHVPRSNFHPVCIIFSSLKMNLFTEMYTTCPKYMLQKSNE
jgi:hypothetical protein